MLFLKSVDAAEAVELTFGVDFRQELTQLFQPGMTRLGALYDHVDRCSAIPQRVTG